MDPGLYRVNRSILIALCVLELEKSQFLPNSVAFLLRLHLCYEQLLKSWNHKTALKRPVIVHDTFIPDGIKTAILMNTMLVEDIGNNRSAGRLCCNLFCTLSSFPFKLGQNVHIRCKPDQRFWFHTQLSKAKIFTHKSITSVVRRDITN